MVHFADEIVTANPFFRSTTSKCSSLNGTSLSPFGFSPKTGFPFTNIMGLLKSLRTQQAQPHAKRQLAAALPDMKVRFPLMLENQHLTSDNASP
jgi:hypothetical protein